MKIRQGFVSNSSSSSSIVYGWLIEKDKLEKFIKNLFKSNNIECPKTKYDEEEDDCDCYLEEVFKDHDQFKELEYRSESDDSISIYKEINYFSDGIETMNLKEFENKLNEAKEYINKLDNKKLKYKPEIIFILDEQ